MSRSSRCHIVGLAIVAVVAIAFFIVSLWLWCGAKAHNDPIRNEAPRNDAAPVNAEVFGKQLDAALPAIDEEKVKENIHYMEQYGAYGAVAIHVTDQEGNPIKGASVRLGFTQPNQDWRAGTVEGETDETGSFRAGKTSNWSCVWDVSKSGFHASHGEVLFTHKGSKTAFLNRRWTDDPIDVYAVLKKTSGATLIHGMHIFKALSFPTNTWVGLDLSTFAIVEPHGMGNVPHILFKSVSDGVFPLSKGGTPGYTNTLHIMVENGGLEILNEQGDSDSPFVSETPTNFATNELIFVYARTRDRIIQDSFLNGEKKEYIVFRSAPSGGGTNDFHSGIIRDLRCAPGKLQMEYFFNPKSGDARIDGDLKSKRDIQF